MYGKVVKNFEMSKKRRHVTKLPIIICLVKKFIRSTKRVFFLLKINKDFLSKVCFLIAIDFKGKQNHLNVL